MKKLDHPASKEKEQLIDISANFELRSKFNETELTKFWIALREEFPEILIQALKLLLTFPTIYLSEKTLSLHAATKTKYRNRLNAESDIILQATSIKPEFDTFLSRIQNNKCILVIKY